MGARGREKIFQISQFAHLDGFNSQATNHIRKAWASSRSSQQPRSLLKKTPGKHLPYGRPLRPLRRLNDRALFGGWSQGLYRGWDGSEIEDLLCKKCERAADLSTHRMFHRWELRRPLCLVPGALQVYEAPTMPETVPAILWPQKRWCPACSSRRLLRRGLDLGLEGLHLFRLAGAGQQA